MAEYGSALGRLKDLMLEVESLNHAGALLGWDQETYMPKGGAPSRARALATVGRLAHERGTSPEYGRLLGAAEAEVANAGLDPESDEARLLWVARRDYERAVKLPPEFVAELRETESLAMHAWQGARQANDWSQFAPHLTKIVELQRKMVELLGYHEHPYDALLDPYEPEMTTAEVRRVFTDLRAQTTPLVKAISANAEAVDDFCLHQHFPDDRQWALSLELLDRFDYDLEHGRLDRSAHPFTQPIAPDDVRVTTRVQPDFFNACFYATAHEFGHALYHMEVPDRFGGTPLYASASFGVDESQSRLWENLIGRSRPFLRGFYPRIQAAFPDQFGSVDVDGFYRAVNKSGPSLIRVEADEVTYNLHIMLRFELETALIEGGLQVEQLPARWNELMEDYLGVRPDSDANGVMQDIHWSAGLFGYFPTYALGNVMSVQLYSAAERETGDLAGRIQQGEYRVVRDWMREHVYDYGRKFPPQVVLERATGQRLTAEPYVNYLKTKFGEIYGL